MSREDPADGEKLTAVDGGVELAADGVHQALAFGLDAIFNVENLLTEVLGTGPLFTQPRSAASRALPVIGGSGNPLTLTFTPQQVAGFHYIVQAVSNLTN